MMGWLHRRTADYLEITAYLVERDHAVAQASLEVLRACSSRDAALQAARESARFADGCRAVLGALFEPGLTEQCTKVRLRDQADADAFAARVQSETGVAMETYRCRRCPRQPVSLEAFWHVTHADPTKRSQNGKADPSQPARLLRHVSPADIAAMRAKAAGEAS
jgi:hypothetical protein